MTERVMRTEIKDARVIVALGAGGVGKTSTAIAAAVLAARLGRRVALLSIDPAKRLAAALGMPLGNQLRRVALPNGVSGSLDAAMLDQKAVFDQMVRRHAPSDQVAEKILAHPLYQACSTNLAGPLEYLALAKLQELAEDHRYDLIVLDTPPDTHALEFLARPNVLAAFVDNKVIGWLIKPFLVASKFGLSKVMGAGEKLMGGIAKVTGMQALRTFAEFFVLMQEVIAGFNAAGEKTLRLLHDAKTRFLVVTLPTLAAERGTKNLALELEKFGYPVGLLLFNRCLPGAVAAAAMALDPADPAGRVLKKRAQGEAEVQKSLVAKLRRRWPEALVGVIEDQDQEIGTLAAVIRLAERLDQMSVVEF